MLCQECFANILFIFTADFLKFCYTTCCWLRWTQISARNHLQCCMWRMFANIYLNLPLILSNGVTRHVVEYDKLRFQPEIICNAVWGMFANIYLFFPLIYPMVSHDMLLSMINSYFSQKSFVMLCEESFQIPIYFYP